MIVMAIGNKFQGGASVFVDAQSGYSIIKPIEADRNRHMYFTSNPFTRKGDELIISAQRDNKENFYLLNFISGVYTQLTDENNLDIPRAYFDKKNDILYFCSKDTIKAVNIRTLETKVIYESQHNLGSIAVTCDGKFIISSHKYPYTYNNNDGEETQIILDRMFKIDTATGEYSVIMHRSFPIDHIQCSPTDPNHIIYCAWGYLCTQHRIWWTNLEGTQGGPLGPEQPNEHRVHEYYTPDGKRIAYHGKFFRLDEQGKFQNIKHTWGIMNVDGSEDRYYTCLPKGMQAGHSIISYNGRMVAADGDDYISLLEFDEDNKAAFFRHIFAHNSSMKSNFVHPHPSFSNDDRYIVFATDFGGKDEGNIYLIDLHSKEEK